MQSSQSYGEFIKGAYRAVFDDCIEAFPDLAKEFSRDSSRVNSAIEQHGLAFACDIMPAFSKHFDKCLAKARLTPSNLIHFGSFKRGVPVPRLLRGLVLRVFDLDGVLREDADPQAIRYLRQVCNLFKKLKIDCGKALTGKTVRAFLQHDSSLRLPTLTWFGAQFCAEDAQDLSMIDLCVTDAEPEFLELESSLLSLPSTLSTFQRVADLMTSLLGVFDPWQYDPKHGPGVVSDLPKGVNKYEALQWSDKLETVFPSADFAYANFSAWVDCLDGRGRSQFNTEPYGRLLAVPKVYSKPRLIASEPAAHQWCQQSIRSYFYNRASETCLRSFVDFRNQRRNGELALAASHSQSHCTIDLSNASDSVTCWLVERFFRRSPSLLAALWATRTCWIQQELCRYSPKYHVLRKYSTMGNATTFPVQSLIFAGVAITACLTARRLRPTLANLKLVARDKVLVFGDDIIVPEYASGIALGLLSDLGFQVNTDKTFMEGNFRESCGVDAFRGHDVTPSRILEKPSRSRPGTAFSTVDVHNNLCEDGYLNLARWLRTAAGRFWSKIRSVKHGSGVFGWSDRSGDGFPTRKRWNSRLCVIEEYCLRLRSRQFRAPSADYAALLQYFIEAPRIVTSNVSTLGFTLRYPKISLTLGWVPVGSNPT